MTFLSRLGWRHLIRYIVVKHLSIQPNEEKDHVQFRIVVLNYVRYFGARPPASHLELFAGIRNVVSRYLPGGSSLRRRALEVDHDRAPAARLVLLSGKRSEVAPLSSYESLVPVRSVHLSNLFLVTQPASPFMCLSIEDRYTAPVAAQVRCISDGKCAFAFFQNGAALRM